MRCAYIFALGVVITTIGAILAVCSGQIVTYFIEKVLPLKADSISFKSWMESEVPMHLDFFFWNWENPEEFTKGGKPRFVEMGPYRYRERHEKLNVTHNGNGTITYLRARWWFFDPDNSNGTLEDNITTINPIAASAAYVTRDRYSLIQVSLSAALRMTNQKIWVTRTVDQLLFEGYSDALITMASKTSGIAQVNIPHDKFGWFYKRNGSWEHDGVFTINTGEDDISKIGLLSSWNYVQQTDFYPGTCGMVNGSAGELFHPKLRKEEPLEMYSPDLCRSVKFEYSREREVHGIIGYEYIGGKGLMDNGTDDPSTECFCGGECVPQGVLNVSTCRFNSPAFVSYPHYLDADPYYLDQVEGLSPDPELHRFRITIEPNTGIPLDVTARFQINFLIQQSRYVTLYSDVKRTFFPMMWFEQRARITPEMAKPLRYLLMARPVMFYITLGVFLGGLLIVLLALLPRFCRTWTLPKLGSKKKDGAVLYKRECIRPLMKGIPETTNSSFGDSADPSKTTYVPT